MLPATLPRGGEDAVRVAVWTALHTAHLIPHVLVVGGATPLTFWMESVGVHVTLLDKGDASAVTSTLLRAVPSPDLLAAIELPVLPSLVGTQHALFTRYDVVWLRAVHAFEPGMLPTCASVPPPSRALSEAVLSFDNVMLVNLACWREHRSALEAAATPASSPSDESTRLAFRTALGGLVLLYSLLYYRGLGMVTVGSLAVAGSLVYLLFLLLGKWIGFTLTLAGIAGAIVAIGVTADSFIIYFERIRDEIREGRSLRTAVETGWSRARRTILVADFVSIIAAVLLYFFAVGGVRGFAFTLGLTTLVDLIVVFVFTKPIVTILAKMNFFA